LLYFVKVKSYLDMILTYRLPRDHPV
jgi:hypothetical protein